MNREIIEKKDKDRIPQRLRIGIREKKQTVWDYRDFDLAYLWYVF